MEQTIQNLYTIIGRKQVLIEGYKNMLKVLQEKNQELETKLKEIEDRELTADGHTGSD